MADIFLSYAKEDRDVARKLSRLLVKAGWTVWWDRRIPAGRTWRRMLETALRDMRCMVVLWSSHSIESDWVKEEAEEGRMRRKLLPVLIETVNPPVGFRTIQAADLTDWDGVGESLGTRQLIADIELLIGKPARPGAFGSQPKIPPGQNANQTRTEVIITGVERAARRAEHGLGTHRDSSGKNAVPWKIIAGAGVALVLALGVIALWRDSAPVTDEVATAVATIPMRSTPEPFSAPKVVKLGIYAARQELKPEETLALSLRGRFSDGSEDEITNAIEWSSSNARVAKVDAEGRVTALQSGTTEIIATYGGVSSSAWTLAVKSLPSKPAPAPALVALTIDAYKKELEPQENIALNVTGKYSDGTEKTLSSGWVLASNNAAVVSVNARGEVEAWRAGNAEIVARSGNVTSAPLRLIVKEPQWKDAVKPRQRRSTEYLPGKTAPEAMVSKTPEAQPTHELSGEQLRAKVTPYISRAKNFRAQGDYRAAMAELATARAAYPSSQEIGAEFEQTRRACIAERKLGNRGLDCSP